MDQASESPPALLLVNLGTPDAPTASAGAALPGRVPARSSRGRADPLAVVPAAALRDPAAARAESGAEIRLDLVPRRFAAGGAYRGAGGGGAGAASSGLAGAHAMRYGNPSVEAALRALREQGAAPRARVAAVPAVLDHHHRLAWHDAIAEAWRWRCTIEMLQDYHRDPGVGGGGGGSRSARTGTRMAAANACCCRSTASRSGWSTAAIRTRPSAKPARGAIAEALGLPRGEMAADLPVALRHANAGCSRTPSRPCKRWPREGVRTIDVVCPGFAVDCLETLEEIAVENADAFRAAGGEALRYIPCLNAGDAHAQALAQAGAGRNADGALMREVALHDAAAARSPRCATDGRRRRSVLALHGWLDNAASFLPLAPHLGDIDLVALDLPGHGRSAHLRARRRLHPSPSAIDDVLDAADALGWERFALLGHSMGAGIASLVAAALPAAHRATAARSRPWAPCPRRPSARWSACAMRSSPSARCVASSCACSPTSKPRCARGCMPGACRAAGLEEPLVRLLVERGVRAVDGGYAWSSDPRLTLPTLVRMTEAQVEDLVAGIECPTLAIFAEPAQPYLPDDLRRASRRRCCRAASWRSSPAATTCTCNSRPGGRGDRGFLPALIDQRLIPAATCNGCSAWTATAGTAVGV